MKNSIRARKTNPYFMTEVDQANMIRRMAAFGLRRVEESELAEVLALGEKLTGAPLAPKTVIARLHAITGVSAWATGKPIDGIYLLSPLSEEGERSVRSGLFSPGAPDRAHICGAGEACYGVYVGVYAGRTKDARRNIMQASATLRVELFGTVPCFARGATDDGARSMESLGFYPIEGGLPDLYVQEALFDPSEKAA